MSVRNHFLIRKLETIVLNLFILLLPTQFGKHFWPDFAVLNGIRVDYLSPTFYVTDGLIVLLLCFWIIRKLKKPFRFSGKITASAIVFLVFILYILMSALRTNPLQNSVYSVVKLLELSFLFFYIITSIPQVISAKRLTCLLAIGVIGESFLAIAQFIHQGTIGGLLYLLGERTFTASTPGIANASLNGELLMRSYGTFPHPNVLGGYLLISMVLIFFVLFPTLKKAWRFLAVAALLVGTVGLVLTLSRVAIFLWVSFVVGVFVWQLVSAQKRKLEAGITLLAVFVLGLTFYQLLLPRFSQTTLVEEAVVQRQLLMESSYQMIAQHPLLGVGVGQFLPTLSTIQSPLSLGLYLQPVHNIFLLLTAEIGVLGLCFVILFFGNCYLRLWRSLKSKKADPLPFALLICLSMMLVMGLFDHYWLTLQQGQLLSTIVLGLVRQRPFDRIGVGRGEKYPNMRKKVEDSSYFRI